jgi:outer membrane receptor protein involved in Fe transport
MKTPSSNSARVLRLGVSCLALFGAIRSLWAAEQSPPDQIVVLPDVLIEMQALDKARQEIAPELGATRYTLDAQKIDTQSQGQDAAFDQTFYRFPGVAQDELDKRLHARGEEANLQYRIDGFLVPDGLIGYGQELATRNLDSVSMVTGTLPAQYGGRTAAIVDMTSKSGQSTNGGSISVYGGSYDTARTTLEYGGNSGQWTWYGNLAFNHDAIGLANPAPTYFPTHDETNVFKGFANLSYLIDASSRVTLIVSGNNNTFQIPNIAGSPPLYAYNSITTFDSSKLNERQSEYAYYEILGYQKNFGDVDLQVSQSFRASDLNFKPDVPGDVIFNGIASASDHHLLSNNLQTDVSDKLNEVNTVRGGASVSIQRATVNTTDTVLPAAWDPSQAAWVQTSSQPIVLTDNYSKTGELVSGYIQDEWKVTKQLTVNAGLRGDLWSAFITENQISPRLNITYKPTEETTLHAGYGRYFTPPPLELIQAGNIAQFNSTTNGVDPSLLGYTAAVKAERYTYYDVGANQDLFDKKLRVGVDAYLKDKEFTLDEGQFGPAMIFSPNNSQKGLVRGIDFTITYDWNNFSFWGNVTRSQALAYGLATGQWQFSADEVAYMSNHWYHLDHDQKWTASSGVAYTWDMTKFYADMLYGSGLFSGFCNSVELSPYATFNVGLTHAFRLDDGSDLKVRLDVTNIADLKYEIRDGSGIGVWAPQYLPRRGVYGGITKTF